MGRWLPCLVVSLGCLFASLVFLFKLIFSANFDVLGWDVLFNRNFLFFAVLFFAALVVAGVGCRGSKGNGSKVEKPVVVHGSHGNSKASIVKGDSSGSSSGPKLLKAGSLLSFTGTVKREGLTMEFAVPTDLDLSSGFLWEASEAVPDDSPSSSGDGEGEFSLFEGKVGRGKK